MARRRISQRDAQAALARVRELEWQEKQRRNAWCKMWPDGVHIGTVDWDAQAMICEAAFTARKLGHAVVAVADDNRRRLAFYALPLGSKE